MKLAAERLRELLDYDLATGIFVRKTAIVGIPAGAVAGRVRADGYVKISVDGKLYYGHRLAWLYVHGEWPLGRLDHEDTIKHHNWIGNLRPATQSQNGGNAARSRANTSGFKGVTYDRAHQAWKAQIRKNRARIHIGLYPTAEAAHAAYVEKARELFGEFARAS